MTDTPTEPTPAADATPSADPAPAEQATADATPADATPDRLSTNPRSPYFDEALLARGIGIRFKGAERRDVEEYCRSEGWIRVALGKKVDRKGNPLTLKLMGEVEAWFERPAVGDDTGEQPSDAI